MKSKNEKLDAKLDKAMKIKEGSKQDKAMDRVLNIKDGPEAKKPSKSPKLPSTRAGKSGY